LPHHEISPVQSLINEAGVNSEQSCKSSDDHGNAEESSSSSDEQASNIEEPSEFSDANFSNHKQAEKPFPDLLASWAVDNNVNHIVVNNLLSVLHTHPCHASLPKDARTLLGTPRSTGVRNVYPGKYWHHGIKKGVEYLLDRIGIAQRQIPPINKLVVGIDGLPIVKASGSQLWPILGLVPEISNKPFLIGCYHDEMYVMLSCYHDGCKTTFCT
jgi:hypothetical protein